jgi:hypothetical protein
MTALRRLGLPVVWLDLLLFVLISLTIVVSLNAVGNILVVAMLVTPAATARLLTDRLPMMLGLSAGIGATSGVVGLIVSYHADAAAGGTIVLVATAVFGLVWLLAPTHGLITSRLVRHRDPRTAGHGHGLRIPRGSIVLPRLANSGRAVAFGAGTACYTRACDGRGQSAVSGLSMFGMAAVVLALLFVVMDVPTLHAHHGTETGLYDHECPTILLAASGGSLGLGSQPLTDLGAAPPAPDALPSPSVPGVAGLAVGSTDTRAPPSSA